MPGTQEWKPRSLRTELTSQPQWPPGTWQGYSRGLVHGILLKTSTEPFSLCTFTFKQQLGEHWSRSPCFSVPQSLPFSNYRTMTRLSGMGVDGLGRAPNSCTTCKIMRIHMNMGNVGLGFECTSLAPERAAHSAADRTAAGASPPGVSGRLRPALQPAPAWASPQLRCSFMSSTTVCHSVLSTTCDERTGLLG